MSSIVDDFSLDDARSQFNELLRRFRNDKQRQDFLLWIELEFKGTSSPGFMNETNGEKQAEVSEKLGDIVLELKKRVPPLTVFPTEKFFVPLDGENSDCNPEMTVHVDAFLYTDDDVDALVEDGDLQRNYCLDCGSKNSKPLNFISHSMSRERLDYVFNAMLAPDHTKKSISSKTPVLSCLLDVGSRLGGTLFSAYLQTDIPKLVGVEICNDFCLLQNEICKKFKMTDRISIIEDNILNQAKLVKEADVVFLNNPFEFFCEKAEQQKIWRFLKANLSKNAILICVPRLEDTFANLQMESELDEWVTHEEPYNQSANDEHNEELSEIQMYRVL